MKKFVRVWKKYSLKNIQDCKFLWNIFSLALFVLRPRENFPRIVTQGRKFPRGRKILREREGKKIKFRLSRGRKMRLELPDAEKCRYLWFWHFWMTFGVFQMKRSGSHVSRGWLGFEPRSFQTKARILYRYNLPSMDLHTAAFLQHSTKDLCFLTI